MTVVKSKLVVRERLGKWDCLSVLLFSDGSVQRTFLCTRDTYEDAMRVINRTYV